MNTADKIPSDLIEHHHSPDVAERKTLDNGFSKGLGFHFQPNEAYWLDAHNHMETPKTHAEIYRVLEEWFGQLDAYRLGKVIAIVNDPDAFNVYRDIAAQDQRFGWLFRIPHDKPDVKLVERAFEQGALGLKLHNSPLMGGAGSHEVWLQKSWSDVFDSVSQRGKALLWHITQRVSTSPYHGGGANSYWENAETGPTTSNEQLLQTALKIADQNPGLTLIGAHQMHVGLDRLEVVFKNHPNVVIDTSCAFFLRWCDNLYPEDRAVLQAFFNRHQDRVLFGTDSSLAAGRTDAYQVQSFLCHARLIHQLRLSDKVLQKIAHGNAERVLGLKPLDAPRRYNSRP